MIHQMNIAKKTSYCCLIVFLFLGCHALKEKPLPQETTPCDSFLMNQGFLLKNPQTNKTSDNEFVILADSLSYSPEPHSSSTNNFLLWICVPLAVISIMLLIYKILRYKRHIRLLKEKKQVSEVVLSNKIDKISESRNKLFEIYIKSCPIYQEIKLLLNENKSKIHNHELLTPQQWDETFSAINSHTDNFIARLQKEYPSLKMDDVRFCSLIKIGLKYADIACILGRTTNMMYKRREMIAKRMKLKKECISLDRFIANF